MSVKILPGRAAVTKLFGLFFPDSSLITVKPEVGAAVAVVRPESRDAGRKSPCGKRGVISPKAVSGPS